MEVRLLGPLVALEAGSPIDIGPRKQRALLAALVVAEGPVLPSRLAEVLWPQGAPAKWPTALYSHVSRLRSALERAGVGERLRRDDLGYSFTLAPEELDAARFGRLLAAGRAALARRDARSAASRLGEALALWQGAALADLRDEPYFESTARHLDEQRVAGYEDWFDARLAIGEHVDVLTEIERHVELHPLRERAWAQLMIALYRCGRQADALRRYQDARTLLAEELGIDPGPPLRALEGAILRQDPDLDLVTAADAASRGEVRARSLALPSWVTSTSGAFVGRDTELAALQDAIDRAGSSRRLVVVDGEAGIGKTRLVREVVAAANERGAVVLAGRCYEEPLLAYQPFAEMLDRLLGDDAEALLESVGAGSGALAALLPDLQLRFPALAQPVSPDPDAARYILFRTLARTFAVAAGDAPLVLVIDDVHWAMPATIRLLGYMLDSDTIESMVIIATARGTDTNPALAQALTEWSSRRVASVVPLHGLDAVEVERLVAERHGDTVLAPELHRTTDGNPFFVEELVRYVAEQGGRAVLEGGGLPDTVRDTIGRRLLRLPDDTRRALGIAAVIGTEFEIGLVAGAAGRSIAATDAALDPAREARVIVDRPNVLGTSRFRHALLRQVLYDALGPARRSDLHRRVGEAIEHTAADIETRLPELAMHFVDAARDDDGRRRAIDYCRRGARRSITQVAYEQAAELLRAAASLSADSELERTVGLELADALARTGDVPGAWECWSRTILAALDAGDTRRAATALASAVRWHSQSPPGWDDLARRTVEQFGRTRSYEKAVLLANLSQHAHVRDETRARKYARAAIEAVPARDDDRRREIEDEVYEITHPDETPAQRVERRRSSFEAARRTGDVDLTVSCMSALRLALLEAGDLGASDAVGEEYERYVQELRIPRYLAGVQQRRAMRALLEGRFADAEAHAQAAVDLQPILDFLEGYAVQLFAIRKEQGRLPEIRPAVEEWMRTDPRPAWNTSYIMLLTDLGELDAAREMLEPLLTAGLDAIPHDGLRAAALATLADAAPRLGDRDLSAELYELLLPRRSDVIVLTDGVVCWGAMSRILGPLARALGKDDAALDHFEHAMAVHERLGARPFLARDRLACAALLAERGDKRRAATLARTGRALAESLGMRIPANSPAL